MADNAPPQIKSWGIAPQDSSCSNFTVWAWVEDGLAGVENVAVHILVIESTDVDSLCAFSESNYTVRIAGFGNSTSLILWVEAYDWGMNNAESDRIQVIGDNLIRPAWGPMLMAVATLTTIAAVIIAIVLHKKTKI